MIKRNIATELGMTNGAEGNVVGWKASTFKFNGSDYPCIETLFVELKNTPFPVNIPGLPENVILIVKTSKQITAIIIT